MMTSKFYFTLLLLFSSCVLIAQNDKIGFVKMDTVFTKLAIESKNEALLVEFKERFRETDSIWVVNYQREAMAFVKDLETTDLSPKGYELRQNRLRREMERIQFFEKTIDEAGVKLKEEMITWSKDFIGQRLRFLGYSKNFQRIFEYKNLLYADKNPVDLTQKLIDLLKNDGIFDNAYHHYATFVMAKTVFDFKL